MSDTSHPATPAETPADEPVMRITREVAAPRELVWDAWTDASRLSQWWGPNGFTTTIHAHDLRPGGTWSFVMHGPDGTDYGNRVVFDRIERPSLLEYRHYAAEDPDDRPHFHARVRFEDTAHGTRVTLTLICHSIAHRDELAVYAVKGGRQTLARFAALVEGG